LESGNVILKIFDCDTYPANIGNLGMVLNLFKVEMNSFKELNPGHGGDAHEQENPKKHWHRDKFQNTRHEHREAH
jgi:hypothetical protein